VSILDSAHREGEPPGEPLFAATVKRLGRSLALPLCADRTIAAIPLLRAFEVKKSRSQRSVAAGSVIGIKTFHNLLDWGLAVVLRTISVIGID
jgi:hypothetical protein